MEAPLQRQESDGFASRRTLALHEVLDGRPSQAARVLVEAMHSVLTNLLQEQPLSSQRGPKWLCSEARARTSHGIEELVQLLGRSPPELIAQHTGIEFVRSEWRAAMELLLVSLACVTTAEDARPRLTAVQAETLSRYLDAFDADDADNAEKTTSFRSKYGGSPGIPDFAVAVITVKNGGETVEAYRAAMQSLRCCLRAEPDFPLGLFLLGMCYHRIGAEPIRASQLFHAAFASADALPRGLRPGPALLMAGVARAYWHSKADNDGVEDSWHAIRHFQGVLRRDAGQEQDHQADFNTALYNVAALWASQLAGSLDVESSSHRDATILLVESFGTSAQSNASVVSKSTSANGSTVDPQVLLASQKDITSVGRIEVEHMAARAALRYGDWNAASDAYAQILRIWPEFQSEQQTGGTLGRDRAGLARIDYIHREYCIALLRAAECKSSSRSSTNDRAAGDESSCDDHDDGKRKRCTAVALCEHVLKYRPNDVILLLLLSEAQYDLGQFEQALSAARVATQTLELLRGQELIRQPQNQRQKNDESRQNADDTFLTALAACGLDGCRSEQKSGVALLQLQSLLAESYHQSAAVLWRMERLDEAIDSYLLADRCLPVPKPKACNAPKTYAHHQPLSSTAETAGLQDRVVFSLTLALWACGRCQEAAERWSVYRGWTACDSSPMEMASASAVASDSKPHYASAYRRQSFSLKQRTLQVHLDSAGQSETSRRQQQRLLMDRLALGQLAN